MVGASIIGGNSGYEEIQGSEILKSYYNGGLDDNNPAELVENEGNLVEKYDDTFSYEDKIRMKSEYDKDVPDKKINQNIYQIRKQEKKLIVQENTTYKIYDSEKHTTVQKKALNDIIAFAKSASNFIINSELEEVSKNIRI